MGEARGHVKYRTRYKLDDDAIEPECAWLNRGAAHFIVSGEQFAEAGMGDLHPVDVETVSLWGLSDDRVLVCIQWPVKEGDPE